MLKNFKCSKISKKTQKIVAIIAIVALLGGSVLIIFRDRIFAASTLGSGLGSGLGTDIRKSQARNLKAQQANEASIAAARRMVKSPLIKGNVAIEHKWFLSEFYPKIDTSSSGKRVRAMVSASRIFNHRVQEDSVPKTLAPEERVKSIIEKFDGSTRKERANNYAASAIHTLFQSEKGLSDPVAFEYFVKHATEYGMSEKFEGNFETMKTLVAEIKASGYPKAYIIAKAKGFAQGEELDDKIKYLLSNPTDFGFAKDIKKQFNTIVASFKSSPASTPKVDLDMESNENTMGDVVEEDDTEEDEDDASEDTGLPQQPSPVLPFDPADDGAAEPDGSATADVVAFETEQEIDIAVAIAGPIKVDEKTIGDALAKAGATFKTSGSNLGAAAKVFVDAVSSKLYPQGGAEAKEFGDKLTAIIDASDGRLLLLPPNLITKLLSATYAPATITQMATAIEDARGVMIQAGMMAKGKDPFSIGSSSPSKELSKYLETMNSGLGEGAAVSFTDILDGIYETAGQQAGDYALAVWWSNGDQKMTDQYLYYLGRNPINNNSEKKVSLLAIFAEKGQPHPGFVMAHYMNSSSMGINPDTASMEYRTVIKEWNPTANGNIGGMQDIGFLAFDFVHQKYYGMITHDYGNKNVSLHSDARTGYVYATIANADTEKALLGQGKMAISKITIAEDGKIGGTFKLANRLFRYNPNSKAFEIPIASIIGQGKVDKLGGKGILGQALQNLSVDTNGNISGFVALGDKLGKNVGGLYFDSTGNIGATFSVFESKGVEGQNRSPLGSISVSKDGVSGAVNVGKLAFGSDVFIGFDKHGISGISAPIGSFGVGVGKDGGISVSYAIPIGGLPIPVSLSQDARGNFGIGIPFVGNIVTFGHEDRDLAPPTLLAIGDNKERAMTKSEQTARAQEMQSGKAANGIAMECIFYKHSFKKMFKTVRTWNTEANNRCGEEIQKEEQEMRANMVFEKYRAILKRNPTQEEFIEWYFYGGGRMFGQSYAFTYSESSTYRTMQTKAAMDKQLKSESYSKKCGTTCSDPANAMPYNPFNAKEVAEYQSKLEALPANQTSEPGTVSMQDFFDAINRDASNDPYFNGGNYNIPGLGAGVTATETITVTASGTATVTVTSGVNSNTTGNDVTTVTTTPKADRVYTDPNKTDGGVLEESDQNIEDEMINANTSVFSPGFNVYTVDSADQAISAQSFVDAGLGIFEFNTDGSGKWRSNLLKDDISVLKAGIGYYIYNPNKEDVSVEMTSAYTGQVKGLNKGWNLLSNSQSEPAKLGSMTYDVIKPDATCQTSDCYETKTVKQVVDEGRTKGKLMKVISGQTDPAKAFEAVDLAQDISLIEIPAKSLYWIYLAK